MLVIYRQHGWPSKYHVLCDWSQSELLACFSETSILFRQNLRIPLAWVINIKLCQIRLLQQMQETRPLFSSRCIHCSYSMLPSSHGDIAYICSICCPPLLLRLSKIASLGSRRLNKHNKRRTLFFSCKQQFHFVEPPHNIHITS